MQNKSLWYILGAIVAIIIAGWLFFMNGNPGSGTATQTPPELLSLKDLLNRQGQQTCTFTTTAVNNSPTTQGTVYLKDGTMRGNFTTSPQGGQTIASHIIVKDGTAYVWSEGIAQGYKMDVSALTSQVSGMQGSQAAIDATAPAGYNCTAGNVDQTVFDVPTNVTFTAVQNTSMPGTGASTGASSSASARVAQCQACDQAPDAATKAQCRQALSC